MKRRVCETCFFFEPAGINNSGWCRHPERQFAAGVRLVVRGNEIACRNGWDVDLWVPAGIEPAGAVDDPDTAAAEGSDRITSIVPARYEPPVERPASRPDEDVVVQHISHPAQHQPAPDKDARDLVTNPRAAILRAREQFKVRQKREGRLADQAERPMLRIDATDDFPESDWRRAADDGDWSDDPQENAPFLDEGARAPRPPVQTVPPVTREEVQRQQPTITFSAEDAERFDSIPTASRRHDHAPTPEPFDETGQDEISRAGEQVFADDDYWTDDEPVFVAEPSHQPRREPFINRFLRNRRERHEQPPIDDSFDVHLSAATRLGPPEERGRYPYTGGEAEEEFVPLNHPRQDPPHRRPDPLHVRSDVGEDGYAMPRGSAQPATLERKSDWDSRDAYEAGYSDYFDEERFYEADDDRDFAAVSAHHHAAGHDERRRTDFDTAADHRAAVTQHTRTDRNSSARPTEPPLQDDRYYGSQEYAGQYSTSASPAYTDHDEYLVAFDEQAYRPQLDDASAWGEDVVIDPVQADLRGSPAQPFELPRWQDDAGGRAHHQPDHRPAPSVSPIAANVPRICRTCRDFRPSESEDRGWCNNAWAFKHRRMVDADTLSCGSSTLGSWWTPNDSVWQHSADVSRHAQETPLLDRLLASRYEPHYESGRRAGGSGER